MSSLTLKAPERVKQTSHLKYTISLSLLNLTLIILINRFYYLINIFKKSLNFFNQCSIIIFIIGNKSLNINRYFEIYESNDQSGLLFLIPL